MIRVCLIGHNTAKEKALLESQSDIRLQTVDVVPDFDMMLNAICESRPDILILSDLAGGLAADDLCFHTYLRHPEIKTLIISDHEADYARLEATGYSCRGFMLHEQRHAIVRAVRVVDDGEAWLSRKLVTTVLDQLAGAAVQKKTKPHLVSNR
jgi:DNA-binding NarL/FixJ family response regulator